MPESGISAYKTSFLYADNSAWNGLKTGVMTTVNALKTGVTTAWNGLKSSVSTTMTSLKTTVQVYFEKEGIDTADSLSEMVLTIMASFAQEESRSISENVKWGIRKRFEAGHEVKVPLYGFYHTDDELFLIQEDEAAIVREVFERFVNGEAPAVIMDDMIARDVKPSAGKCWKRLQIDRMIKNEKYAGDVVLQKTYIENHLTHKQIRNHGDLPKFRVENAHEAIVDRHMWVIIGGS